MHRRLLSTASPAASLLSKPSRTMAAAAAASSASASFRIQRDPAFPHAQLPTRGSAQAAGYDLYAAEDVLLPARNGRKVVPTGIRLAVPQGCYGRVAPRSGLASKHGIDVGAGVIDADYRGLLGVLLFNFGDADFQIKTGDRIAQLVLEQIRTPDVVEVESLEETDRGAAGFGSTGGFNTAASAAPTLDPAASVAAAAAAGAAAGAAAAGVKAAAPDAGAAAGAPAPPSKKRRVEDEAAAGAAPLEAVGNTMA